MVNDSLIYTITNQYLMRTNYILYYSTVVKSECLYAVQTTSKK